MHRGVTLLAALFLASSAAGFDIPDIALAAFQVHGNLEFPVSFAFAPDGRILVTEKAGTIKVLDGGQVRAWASLAVDAGGEQGLLGLALHPEFSTNGWVYVYYTDPANGSNRVVRFTESGGVATGLEVIVDGIPRASNHNGGILVFGTDGSLFVSTGDALLQGDAQAIGRLNGKVLRVAEDGTVPSDNPFPGNLAYTSGHRNVFGLAVDPMTGRVWATENGPSRHDEVNRLLPGGNYGWPTVTGHAGQAPFIDPAYVFDSPLPALTQATFYDRDGYDAASRGALFFGGWNTGAVYRAALADDRGGIVSVEIVHTEPDMGILDLEVGPDDRLYFSAQSRTGSGGGIFVLETLSPSTRGDQHLLAYAAIGGVVGVLVAAYAWKRRKLRQRS